MITRSLASQGRSCHKKINTFTCFYNYYRRYHCCNVDSSKVQLCTKKRLSQNQKLKIKINLEAFRRLKTETWLMFDRNSSEYLHINYLFSGWWFGECEKSSFVSGNSKTWQICLFPQVIWIYHKLSPSRIAFKFPWSFLTLSGLLFCIFSHI